jgi:hypothetical protein
MAYGVQVTFDANDPQRLIEFWSLALGYIEQPPPTGYQSWEEWARLHDIPSETWGDFGALIDPNGFGPRLFFQRVPEQKTAKNRVHLDVNVGAGIPEEAARRRAVDEQVARLEAAGGTKVRALRERGEYWVVMQDPEGNEFCVQ